MMPSIPTSRSADSLSTRSARALVAGLLCTLGAAGVGCSSSDSDSGGDDALSGGGVAGGTDAAVADPGTGDAAAPNAAGGLAGRWERCGSLTDTYVFTADRFEQFISYHDTPDCSGEPRREEGLVSPDEAFTAGSYVLGESVTTEEGLEARAIDLTTDTVSGALVFESIRVTQYDIVYTETPGQLVFSGSTGTSPETRPTALDFERPYLAK